MMTCVKYRSVLYYKHPPQPANLGRDVQNQVVWSWSPNGVLSIAVDATPAWSSCACRDGWRAIFPNTLMAELGLVLNGHRGWSCE